MHGRLTISALAAICGAHLFLAPSAARADEPPGPDLQRFRADNLALYHDLRFDEARAAAEAVLAAPGEEKLSRLRALSTLVAIHCSLGNESEADAAVAGMLEIDRDVTLLPPRSYASPVVQCFYVARGRIEPGVRPDGTRKINSLAVGEFRNHSVLPGSKSPFNLDHFARGLGLLVQYDLASVTDLDLVDRERLASLEREIAAGSGYGSSFDDEMRIAAGRLCGAHAFLFGSVMMVDGETVRIVVRLVATATGEVLLAERVEGKLRTGKDLVRLEERLVRELIGPRIDGVVEAYNGKQNAATVPIAALFATRKEEWNRDDRYLGFLLDSGEALRLEDAGDYGAAMRVWSELAREFPGDPRVKNRLLGLRAYLHGRAVAQNESKQPGK